MDLRALGKCPQDTLDHATALKLNDLEKSIVPELHERRHVKVRMEPQRMTHRRVLRHPGGSPQLMASQQPMASRIAAARWIAGIYGVAAAHGVEPLFWF